MNELILNKAKSILKANEVSIVERLLGGMSNYTYVINADNVLYTFRYPGNFSEYFVDRNIEKKNIALVESLGITNKTVYLNTTDGEKIAKYVKGISLNLIEAKDYPIEKVSNVLKKIHNSNIVAENDYNPFSRLSNYENHIIEIGFTHPNKYNELKDKYFTYKDRLESVNKVFCHGDAQPSNFIITENDLMIVDFEFSGNNDPIYDIACFSNIRIEDGYKLLNVYFDNVDNDKLFRFYAWRCFQCFQWFNVAVFKDLKGMSELLHIDFKKVSEHYLHLIEVLFNEMIKYL